MRLLITSILLLSLLFTLSHAHNIVRIHPHSHRLSHPTTVIHVSTIAAASAKPAAPKAAPSPKAAPAPTPPPTSNLTSLIAKKCKTFADLLSSIPDAASTFQSSTDGGISVFCPSDSAMKSFLPTYKNLTAEGKLSVLLFHAIPVYYSLVQLKTNNGVMNTLATDGTTKNYNFTLQDDGDHVMIKTAADSPAKITGTLYDKEPVSIFTIDGVLEPEELFAPAEPPALAPSPVADAPKAAKGKKRKHATPAPGPAEDDETPADQSTSDNWGVVRVPATRWVAAVAAAVLAVVW